MAAKDFNSSIYMKRLLGVITLLLFVNILFAQPPVTEAQAQAELDKIGVDEEVMRKKLLERGIDIDNIDQNDPRALLEVEKAIQEILVELEACLLYTSPSPRDS